MCISNIGHRRQYSGAAARGFNNAQSTSLMDRVVSLKEELQASTVAPKSPTSTVETHPAEFAIKQAKKREHIIVQHNYHDHCNDNPADYQEEHPARGGVTTPFPIKLHEMLDAIARDGFEDIISWQPHGRCFLVHKPKEFVTILPQYFKLSKLASFQRQLNLYGFQRLTRGQDRGGYYHELFLRDRVYLSHSIQRIKVKGTGVRARSNPDQEPNFWAMPWVGSDANTGNDQQMAMETPMFTDTSVGQLPLQLSFPVIKQSNDFMNLPTPLPEASVNMNSSLPDNDLLLDAFSKPFHYLDPFQPSTDGNWTVDGVNDLLSAEAESFFEDFDFPDDIGQEIEDDKVFGDLLEQMIA